MESNRLRLQSFTPKEIIGILLVLALVGIAVYNRIAYRIPIGDELLYSFVLDEKPLGDNDYSRKVTDFTDALTSQYEQYFASNGRFPVHVLVQMFAGPWGYEAWSVFASLMMVITIILFMRIINDKFIQSPLMWLLVAVSFLYLYQNDSWLWYSITLGMNYLYPIMLVLMWVYLMKYCKAGMNTPVTKSFIWILGGVLLSVATGWSVECYSFPLCGAVLIELIWNKRKHYSIFQVVMICSLCIGAVLLFVSPGNFNRLHGTPPIKMFFNGIDFLFHVYAVWILAAVLIVLRIVAKHNIRDYFKQERFWWLCLGFAVAFGLVANTLPKSFNGVAFFAYVLVFKAFSYMKLPKLSQSIYNGLFISIFALISVHQYYIVLYTQKVLKIHYEFVNEYRKSTDGIMVKPEFKVPFILKPYVKTWFQTWAPGWNMCSLSAAYTNYTKPLILLDSMQAKAMVGSKEFFSESNRIPGSANLYYDGSSYLWSTDNRSSYKQIKFSYAPLSLEDMKGDLMNSIWYIFVYKKNSFPNEEIVAIPKKNDLIENHEKLILFKPYRKIVRADKI